MTSTSPSILSLSNIHRSYDLRTEALKGVDLQVEPGEVVGLLGRNGAGKTTLLRVALGLLQQHQGTAHVFGLDPRVSAVEVKRRIGYVAESQSVPGHMSVRALLDLHRELYATWDRDLERLLLQRLEISATANVSQLSKGEARKVILLCAIAHHPELLVLDEPAGGLDPAARREFLEVSIEMLNRDGATILFSSHYMGDVERIASRAVVLDKGLVVVDEPLDALQESYCVVTVPVADLANRDLVDSLPGLIRARYRNAHVDCIFSRPPQTSLSPEFSAALGATEYSVRHLPLEDLFIAMVGGGA